MGKTLEAIRNQTVDFPYEVIVIDSSDDGTTELIRNGFPEVRLHHLERKTLPGSGRNLGIREARGGIVAFTDSDCVPDPDWLQRIHDRHRELGCEAVGGSVVNGYPKSYIAWVSHLIEFNEWTEKSKSGFVQNIPTCNISYKKNLFEKLHVEFTDNFPTEDTILNWHITSRGGRIYFDPAIRLVHLNRMQFRKLFSHQYRLGRAVAVERQITDLPGRILLKYRILCLGIPLVRWALALKRLAGIDLKQTLIFLWITPLFLSAALAWSFGFMTRGEARDAEIRIHEN
jgi:glycosyltransferase involved in cell wall biosynthesis